MNRADQERADRSPRHNVVAASRHLLCCWSPRGRLLTRSLLGSHLSCCRSLRGGLLRWSFCSRLLSRSLLRSHLPCCRSLQGRFLRWPLCSRLLGRGLLRRGFLRGKFPRCHATVPLFAIGRLFPGSIESPPKAVRNGPSTMRRSQERPRDTETKGQTWHRREGL